MHSRKLVQSYVWAGPESVEAVLYSSYHAMIGYLQAPLNLMHTCSYAGADSVEAALPGSHHARLAAVQPAGLGGPG